MLLEFDFDPETGEYTPISSEIVDSNSKKSSTKSSSKTTTKATSSIETGVVLESNKLILSEEAATLLGAKPEDRIAINYDKKGRFYLPVISLDEKKGNKLTKSNTISYRGKANEELARYGSIFTLEPAKKEGTFFLIGDKNAEESPIEDNIVVDEESNIDVPFTLNLDETEAQEITSFNFNDIDLS